MYIFTYTRGRRTSLLIIVRVLLFHSGLHGVSGPRSALVARTRTCHRHLGLLGKSLRCLQMVKSMCV